MIQHDQSTRKHCKHKTDKQAELVLIAMRVLNIDVTVDPITGGGCAERTFQMSRALVRNGVECDLLILDIGLTPERLKLLEGVDVHIQTCLIERFYVPRFSIRRVKELVAKSDIVHLMGHWEFPDALIYPIIRRCAKPYVNCPAGSLKVQGRSRFIKSWYNRIIGNRIVRNASRLIAISPNEYSQFAQYGANQDNIALVPNGINPEEYVLADDALFRNRYALGEGPFLLFIGRLNPIKGPDLLLKAFIKIADNFSDHQLIFAGPDDGVRSELQDLALEAGIQGRVHFTGFLDQPEKSMALNAADLLVIPSRSEAMSIVVLEAGAASTPVLATDQCGLNEIEAAGGGMISPVSVDGLAQSLREMLADGAKLQTMGRSLHKFVLADFTWQAMAERLIAIYQEILDHS